MSLWCGGGGGGFMSVTALCGCGSIRTFAVWEEECVLTFSCLELPPPVTTKFLISMFCDLKGLVFKYASPILVYLFSVMDRVCFTPFNFSRF